MADLKNQLKKCKLGVRRVFEQKTHSGRNKQNGWRKPLKEPRVVSRTELVKVLSKHWQLCQHNTSTDWLKALK